MMQRSRNLLLLLCFTVSAMAAPRTDAVLWRDPGRVESLDLYYGPGGRSTVPRAPFRFVADEKTGSTKKMIVRDAGGRTWEVKFGEEVKAEVFATRMVWALGYYADPAYFVARGTISGRPFRNARFELRTAGARFRPDVEWNWNKNPFTGTRELNGLRILVMLLSNWDNKDARNFSSNTGVLEHRFASGDRRLTYYVTDWGASMGRWGGYFTREKWACADFADQTPKLIRGVEAGEVEWGFKGQHSGEFRDDLTTEDVRWLMRYLGRIRPAQISAALHAAGAGTQENRCFTTSLRQRIDALRRVAAQGVSVRARAGR